LPGGFAERRHVGVLHVSNVIHNEGNVQTWSKASTKYSNRFSE
jgi:hypothetical protein